MEHALNNFRQALREAAAKLGLPAFWRWWTAELASLAPAAPRTALRRRRLRPILAFGDGVAVLWEPRVQDGTLVLADAARVPLGGDPVAVAQAGRSLIASLPRSTSRGGVAKVVVALPRAQILRKQFTLPAAVEENLKEAIAYDLDRHTPFPAEQLYFDAVVIGRDAVKKEIRVDWAAALRASVDAARRHAESWGALVVGVTPESPEPGSAAAPPAVLTRLNLLPEDERPDTVFWRRPGFLLPAALLALLALAAVVLPIWQKRDYVIALNETTEQARAQANASDALRQQLDQVIGDYNFALGRKYAYPSTVQLLEDVTKILPDDTWLTQLEVKSVPKGKDPHRDILLRGESGNAGRLVSALEESNLVEQAAPRSPTTKIQPGPGEVFDLGAQLKPLPLPEPIQLASSSLAAEAKAGAPPPQAPAAGAPAAPPAATATSAAAAPGAPAAATAASPPAGTVPAVPAAAPRDPAPAAATTAHAGPEPATAPATAASAPPRPPPAAASAPPAPLSRTLPGRSGPPPANAGPLSAGSRVVLPPGAPTFPVARPAAAPARPAVPADASAAAPEEAEE